MTDHPTPPPEVHPKAILAIPTGDWRPVSPTEWAEDVRWAEVWFVDPPWVCAVEVEPVWHLGNALPTTFVDLSPERATVHRIPIEIAARWVHPAWHTAETLTRRDTPPV